MSGHQATLLSGFLRASELAGRGWTPAMIRDILGEPDTTRPNPVYKSQPPMRLWAEWRVLEAEASSQFAVAKRHGAKRRAAAKSAACARREETVRWACSVRITIPLVPDLRGEAIRAYNAHRAERGVDRGDHDGPSATRRSNAAFLDRIVVNHLRHRASEYEELLGETYGRTGVDEARQIIRCRVYAAIAERYPHLRAECDRQLVARGLEATTIKEDP